MHTLGGDWLPIPVKGDESQISVACHGYSSTPESSFVLCGFSPSGLFVLLSPDLTRYLGHAVGPLYLNVGQYYANNPMYKHKLPRF